MTFSEEEERNAAAAAVGGMLHAKLYIVAPFIVALLFILVVGEASYLSAVVAASYGLLNSVWRTDEAAFGATEP